MPLPSPTRKARNENDAPTEWPTVGATILMAQGALGASASVGALDFRRPLASPKTIYSLVSYGWSPPLRTLRAGSMPTNVEALPSAQTAPAIDYSRTVDELVELYAKLTWRQWRLPSFVRLEVGRSLWTAARAGEVIAGFCHSSLLCLLCCVSAFRSETLGSSPTHCT